MGIASKSMFSPESLKTSAIVAFPIGVEVLPTKLRLYTRNFCFYISSRVII